MQLPACVLPPPRPRPQSRPPVSPEILRTPVGRISPSLMESTEDRALLFLQQHGESPLHEIADGIGRGHYVARDALRRLVALDRIEATPGIPVRDALGVVRGRTCQNFRLTEQAHG